MNNTLALKKKIDLSWNYKHLKQWNYLIAKKKLKDKTKKGKKVPRSEVVEVVSVQCDILINQYLKKSEVLYSFTPSKSYAYLLNA